MWVPTRVDLLGGAGAVVGRHDGGVLGHGRVVIARNLLGCWRALLLWVAHVLWLPAVRPRRKLEP